MIRSIHLASAVLITSASFATHIIGGELYYDHLQGDQYMVTLKMYRDCGPGNTNNQGFDASAELGVYTGGGVYLFSEHADFPGATAVPVTLHDPCLTAPPTVCVEAALYTFTVDLPPTAEGYYLTYQRCCRSPTVMNIPNPGDWGLTCTVQVPGQALALQNSSPRFTSLPPIALCLDKDLTFDYSATDPDGDQLVYSLSTPFTGGDAVNTTPAPPTGPPYTMVPFGTGFSEAYPMNSDPPAAVDAATGTFTAHPSSIGSYTVCVSVKEFRNGALLSEVRRDFRFDVVVCTEPVAFFTIAPESPQFAGTPIALDGTGSNGAIEGWAWSLDGNAMPWEGPEPMWTDPLPGTHTITLTVSTATGCTSSFERVYVINPGPIIFPNIFSPNGDATNSKFEIPNAQYQPNTLHVYNRWGMLVYEANNYQNQWTASGVPDGTYYYKMELPEEHREHIGAVTIVR